MVKVFLHARLQKLTQLLRHSSDLVARHNRGDPALAESLLDFLDRSAGVCRGLGLHEFEARAVELKAHCLMARRGIDPATLEKHATRRRELEAKTVFRVLMTVSEQLRAAVEQDRQALASAETLLRPLMLAGLQRGIVVAPSPGSRVPAQAGLDALWRHMLADPDLGLAAKQLAMTASLADVVLLLGDLLSATAPAPRRTRAKPPADPPGQ